MDVVFYLIRIVNTVRVFLAYLEVFVRGLSLASVETGSGLLCRYQQVVLVHTSEKVFVKCMIYSVPIRVAMNPLEKGYCTYS